MTTNDDDVIDRMKYCSRAYNNESNDQLNAMWGFFTHSGERKYFMAAEAFGRHMADVDICHGNRRIFDVCGEIADWVMSQQEACGITRNRGSLVREFTTPVTNLFEFYQATRDRR